jgi:hypothetical protein
MTKKRTILISLNIGFLLILAAVAVYTATRLFQLRKQQ